MDRGVVNVKIGGDFMARIFQEPLREAEDYTIEEAIEALEKQIPLRVEEVHTDEYFCPACGAENCCNDGTVEDKYCPECGQAIYQGN